MSTVELIIFCGFMIPLVAAFIWALVKETQVNARMRRSIANLADVQMRFYRFCNCILYEKYEKILTEKEKNNEN